MNTLVAVRTDNISYAAKVCSALHPNAAVCSEYDWKFPNEEYDYTEARKYRRLDVTAYIKNGTDFIFVIISEPESDEIYSELASEYNYRYFLINVYERDM